MEFCKFDWLKAARMRLGVEEYILEIIPGQGWDLYFIKQERRGERHKWGSQANLYQSDLHKWCHGNGLGSPLLSQDEIDPGRRKMSLVFFWVPHWMSDISLLEMIPRPGNETVQSFQFSCKFQLNYRSSVSAQASYNLILRTQTSKLRRVSQCKVE